MSLLCVWLLAVACVPSEGAKDPVVSRADTEDTGPGVVGETGEADACAGFVGQAATPEELAATPRSDPEAEGLALCLSGGLVADEASYARVQADLPVLESLVAAADEADDVPEWYDYYEPSWRSVYYPYLDVCSDDTATAHEYDTLTGTPWDCLNTYYRAEVIDDFVGGCAELYFQGMINVRYLEPEYLALPGIADIKDNVGGEGDGSRFGAVADGDTIHYVFDHQGGDCPSGCAGGIAYYLQSTAPGEVALVDEWRQGELSEGEARPAWTAYLWCDWEEE